MTVEEAKQLEADALLYTNQKQAEGDKALADAQAYTLTTISEAIRNNGELAAQYEIKKLEAEAITKIGGGEGSKIVLLPSSVLGSFEGMAQGLVNFIKK